VGEESLRLTTEKDRLRSWRVCPVALASVENFPCIFCRRNFFWGYSKTYEYLEQYITPIDRGSSRKVIANRVAGRLRTEGERMGKEPG